MQNACRKTEARRLAVAGAVWLAAASSWGGCTSNPYYIGAICPAFDGGVGATSSCASSVVGEGGADPGVTFAIDLDQSGASHLTDNLPVVGVAIQATLRLRGESANMTDWSSDQGARFVRSTGAPTPEREAPFTDGTRAVALATDAPSYVAESAEAGALDADDFVSEVVLRAPAGAAVLDKRSTGAGWSLETTAGGALTLEVRDGQRLVALASEPLIARAWYHCMFWFSRSAGGRAFCNARGGAVVDVSAIGSLASATNLTIGGGGRAGGERVDIAHFALFRASPGGLGDAGAWQAIARQRFADLTGARPRIARGNALPAAGLRESAAYLDLEREGDPARRLFLVGPDWPRITCRAAADGVRDCGYLGEGDRTRVLEPRADAWSPSEVGVNASNVAFADADQQMFALVPSTSLAPHFISRTGTLGPARQSLSFFARADHGQWVGATVSDHEMAIFDVRAGAVVSMPPGVQATIERWGADLFRCAYVFDAGAGDVTYGVQVLNDVSGAPFAGDGTSAWADVAGLQLDIARAYPGTLLGADTQVADRLTFVADDGNLPQGSAVSVRSRLLLPPGPRLTDQAILNLNRGGTFENQIELYVTGKTGRLKFWGLVDGMPHWAFEHSASPIDGGRHSIEGDWSISSADLLIDGAASHQDALLPNDPPFSLDRIEVGYSSNSSGSLEGLVAGIAIAAH